VDDDSKIVAPLTAEEGAVEGIDVVLGLSES